MQEALKYSSIVGQLLTMRLKLNTGCAEVELPAKKTQTELSRNACRIHGGREVPLLFFIRTPSAIAAFGKGARAYLVRVPTLVVSGLLQETAEQSES